MPTPPPATPPEVSIFLEYHAALSIFLGLVMCVLICYLCRIFYLCRMYGKKRTPLLGAPALNESLMGGLWPYTEVTTIRIDPASKAFSASSTEHHERSGAAEIVAQAMHKARIEVGTRLSDVSEGGASPLGTLNTAALARARYARAMAGLSPMR